MPLLLTCVASCSSIDGEHLVGLWKSNKELTIQNNVKGIEFIVEELGKTYHYYNENRMAVIYLNKKDDGLLDDIVNGQYAGNNSDSGFVYYFDYKVVSRDENSTVIRKQMSFGIENEHVLHFDGVENCYFIDPSDDVDYIREYFCRVNETVGTGSESETGSRTNETKRTGSE
jgi:uncharacterized protein YneR